MKVGEMAGERKGERKVILLCLTLVNNFALLNLSLINAQEGFKKQFS